MSIKSKVNNVNSGDICAVVGLENFEIGDTIADFDNPEALPTINIDEPTMSMLFTINDSPFFGKEGKYVTSRHIKDRLEQELERNLALRLEDTGSADKFLVFGRGGMHLSVLIMAIRSTRRKHIYVLHTSPLKQGSTMLKGQFP